MIFFGLFLYCCAQPLLLDAIETTASMEPTTIILLGPMEWETKAKGIWSGTNPDLDTSLTELGKRDAEILTTTLSNLLDDKVPEVILSAPWKRSRETIAPFSNKYCLVIVEDLSSLGLPKGALNETNHGRLAGMTKAERDQVDSWKEHEKLPFRERFNHPLLNDDPAVVSLNVYSERLVQTLKKIAQFYPGKIVIVVGGGGGLVGSLQERACFEQGCTEGPPPNKPTLIQIKATKDSIVIQPEPANSDKKAP